MTLAPALLALLVRVGTAAGLPAELLPAVAWVESRGHAHAGASPCGAVGLMQLTPAIYRTYRADPYRPASAARAAARYIRALRSRAPAGAAPLPWAIAAYGAGPGRAEGAGGQRYLRRVLRAMALFRGVRYRPGIMRVVLVDGVLAEK